MRNLSWKIEINQFRLRCLESSDNQNSEPRNENNGFSSKYSFTSIELFIETLREGIKTENTKKNVLESRDESKSLALLLQCLDSQNSDATIKLIFFSQILHYWFTDFG